MSFIQRETAECKIESFYTTGRQGRQMKVDCFSVDGFFSHCNTVFEATGGIYPFCPCKEMRPSLTEEDIPRGTSKKNHDELRRDYFQEKGFTVMEMWECEWWKL